jgi:hypothetical protein
MFVIASPFSHSLDFLAYDLYPPDQPLWLVPDGMVALHQDFLMAAACPPRN